MSCSICDNEAQREFVNRLLAEGASLNRVERASKTPEAIAVGIKPVKGETVKRHSQHLTEGLTVRKANNGKSLIATASPVGAATPVAVAAKVATGQATQSDLATLVRDQAVEKLEAGDLRLTLQHGLQAQQMLDRRAEKAQDRVLRVQLARILLGIQPPSNVLPPLASSPKNVTPGP